SLPAALKVLVFIINVSFLIWSPILSASASDHLAHYSKEIAPQDLLHIGFAVTALKQHRRQRGHFRHVFQPRGHSADTVPVAADADIIGADEFDDVINVSDGVLDRRLVRFHYTVGVEVIFRREFIEGFAREVRFDSGSRGESATTRLDIFLAEKTRAEVYPDHTAVFRQGANHVIGHIARHVHQRAAARVRGDDWLCRDRERVVEG